MKPSLTSVFALLIILFSLPAQAWFDFRERKAYAETKYPIVLAHGMFGFDEILGLNYWYRIPETLQANGADVFVTAVSNSNTPEVRGEQLIPQIEQVLAITGAEKVNIIAHSHGGPTSRYVASVRPDLVASITTISGVNDGTPVANTLDQWMEDYDSVHWVIDNLGNALSQVVDILSGGGFEQDLVASIHSMTYAEAAAFNAKHPDGLPQNACAEGPYEVNGIRYFSWAGARVITNTSDPFDLISGAGSLFFERTTNDGLVSPCSSHLGMVIRNDYLMNHFDEVNQFMGMHGILDTDPLTLFRVHANRLQREGL
ncbi:MAG: lipase [Oceanospirillaceae bacterium]|nr:lipase [Oceanospirillaceae bacterium]|tara:strand:- start:1562 stop:2503 length:942 start_codon:yes stop_codon:yes gene_type:complete